MTIASIKDLVAKLNPSEWTEEAIKEYQNKIAELDELNHLRITAQSGVIKKLISEFVDKIEEINKILLEKRDLETIDRLNLIDRKQLYNSFIKRFDWEDQQNEIIAWFENEFSDL